MIDYYYEFIKPREIPKDINFFYDKITDIICNDLFGKYLYGKRKKEKNDEFILNGFLSESGEKTRLRFNNDTLVIRFLLKRDGFGHTTITEPIFVEHRIDGIVFNIDVVITYQEEKHKIIYPHNQAFVELRKRIHEINEFYISNFRKSEESIFPIINKKVKKLKKSFYFDWNKLVWFIKDCTDPSFDNNLNRLDEIVCAMDSSVLTPVYKMIHNTHFFLKYAHHRQIKYNKFIKSLRKLCLDDNEIIDLSNKLASCFGHKNKDYEDCLSFIENVTNHFNTICYVKETKINSHVEKVWETTITPVKFYFEISHHTHP